MVGDNGEIPDDVDEETLQQLDLGESVYDSDGNELGTIRGFDDAGIYVTMREGYEALSVEHARTGHEFGEGFLMWRCAECGEMGEIDDGIPETCPNCDAPKEDIYYWTED
jgi:rubrerythrin